MQFRRGILKTQHLFPVSFIADYRCLKRGLRVINDYERYLVVNNVQEIKGSFMSDFLQFYLDFNL